MYIYTYIYIFIHIHIHNYMYINSTTQSGCHMISCDLDGVPPIASAILCVDITTVVESAGRQREEILRRKEPLGRFRNGPWLRSPGRLIYGKS